MTTGNPPPRSNRRNLLRSLGSAIAGAVGLSNLGTATAEDEENPAKGNGLNTTQSEVVAGADLLKPPELDATLQQALEIQEGPPPAGFRWFELPAYQWAILYRPDWMILRPATEITEQGPQFNPIEFHATSMGYDVLGRDLVVRVDPTSLSLQEAYWDYVTRLSERDPNFTAGQQPPTEFQLRTGQQALVLGAVRTNLQGELALAYTLVTVVRDRLYTVVYYGAPDYVSGALHPQIFAQEMDEFNYVEFPTIFSSFSITY